MKNYLVLEQLTIAHTYGFRGLSFVKGEGVFLFDQRGKKFLDLGSNYGVNILGYNHPTWTKAIQSQITRLVNLHSSFANDVRAEVGLRLRKLAKNRLGKEYKIIFASSGSEAVDNAVKIGLFLSQKKKILCFTKAYHGKTFLSLALTDNEKYKKGIPTVLDNLIVRGEFNNIKDLENKFNQNIAIVVVELIQGDGGVRVGDFSFIKRLSELAEENNTILIVDEIQTGVGRTGRFFASEHYNLAPDILLLGKGIAGGIPASVMLVGKHLADKLYKGIQTSTFGGNPLAVAGICAVLDIIDDSLLHRIEAVGDWFLQKLKNLDSKNIVDIRGKGLMIGVQVVENMGDEILKNLQKNGVIALPASSDVVRFLPPLILEKPILENYWQHIEKSFC